MLNILADILVIAGIGILVGALRPVGQLIAQLPTGHIRYRWRTLTALIVLFIVGYLAYAVVFWNRRTAGPDIIVPGVFFFGACFVWLTITLSLQTAIDIRRVTLLEQENITDPLIGIYNRRYLERRLAEEFRRARRYGLPLSVLLLDIDHFKRVNDMHGHPAGDRVLSYLGRLVLHAIRETDIPTRYGGEEFLIIAPNTTPSAAQGLAERLRQHVETHELVLSSESGARLEIRITVSIGVASLTPDVADGQQLISRADGALYRAKQEGRNRVVTHSANAPLFASPAT